MLARQKMDELLIATTKLPRNVPFEGAWDGPTALARAHHALRKPDAGAGQSHSGARGAGNLVDERRSAADLREEGYARGVHAWWTRLKPPTIAPERSTDCRLYAAPECVPDDGLAASEAGVTLIELLIASHAGRLAFRGNALRHPRRPERHGPLQRPPHGQPQGGQRSSAS